MVDISSVETNWGNMKIILRIKTGCLLLIVVVSLSACRSAMEEAKVSEPRYPDTIASNAFLYYRNLDQAVQFYTFMLGFKLV